ncbi:MULTISPECIES: diaminopropionate ammonia-lyase [unclassified Leptolyngbya]|uniref:diaminopropionate ammonia-lyase n=1 Tax=unclassified Leptolyngbya TaxID=2650499 RepID=UPI001682B617|nr:MULTISPECIES: diaminopropionate ammonia-lyase [unclassified Leptolyngbya]MBD1911905.1 diaminopropionate ammonia-lyase [Leptolyngbya sp. FACHB-8]MBD2156114.1 diaminopropionate ammonia-lyase [Leptolyngbya sp. FACHB-16]
MTRQPIQIWKNPHRSQHYDTELKQILNRERATAVMSELSSWPGYEPTPLRSLPGLSQALGVTQIGYKDEATRFGMGSFKALGGAYAVMRQVAQYLQVTTGDPDISLEDVRSGRYAKQISDLVVTTATDGNHGRSVAWGAQQAGCTCVIFIHEGVSEEREQAIAQFGARVERIPGNYDSSVRWADAQSAANNWVLIADTSYPGYTEIPCDVMQGYSVMAEEALQQWQALWSEAGPTHVFVQAGVGGLAAAICAHLWECLGDRRPIFIVVEPENSACLYETAQQDQLVDVSGSLDTLMGCLSAGRASLLAWDILRAGADFFVTIPDAAAAATMRVLAQGTGGDRPIIAGESGAAGMAALLTIAKQSGLRSQIQLEADSRVLLFGTEGAMDPKSYAQIVGKTPSQVAELCQ